MSLFNDEGDVIIDNLSDDEYRTLWALHEATRALYVAINAVVAASDNNDLHTELYGWEYSLDEMPDTPITDAFRDHMGAVRDGEASKRV